MQEKFEPYQAVNQSRLEPWRSQIVEMRSLNWPFQKVANWLKQHAGIVVTLQAVHQFCKVRGIAKGSAAKLPPPTPVKVSRVGPRGKKANEKKLFEYDGGDAPIDLSHLKSQK